MFLWIFFGIVVYFFATGRAQLAIGVATVQQGNTAGEQSSVHPASELLTQGLIIGAPTPQPEASYFPGGNNYIPATGPDPTSEEVYLTQ